MAMSEIHLEIDVNTLKQMIDDNSDFYLLDCREQTEYDIARIEGSTLIPLAEIQYRLEELESCREQQVVVHCHHGMRSMQVTSYLREMGFAKTQSLTGGIDAWSLSIDPSIPRYS